MNAIPAMPNPTTTTRFLCDGGRGYFELSSSSVSVAFDGEELIAIPGEEVAHDMAVTGESTT